MWKTVGLIILTVLALSACRTGVAFKDTQIELQGHFKLRQASSEERSDSAKTDCVDTIVPNPTDNGSQYNACGFPVPDLSSYHVVSTEYVPMPDHLKGKMYIVTFKNKHGDVVIKEYHKTHPMAYTVQKTGETPYTIVDTTCKEIYDTMYFGKYEIPECVLELYNKVEVGGYLPGQFEEQEGFIKLHTPEPDDFNPHEDEPFSVGKHWKNPVNGGMRTY